jgi:hypothetical protein
MAKVGSNRTLVLGLMLDVAERLPTEGGSLQSAGLDADASSVGLGFSKECSPAAGKRTSEGGVWQVSTGSG